MGTALDYIHNFFEKYLTIPEIYPSDIFEIVIISVLCYYVILWFRKSRAWTLLKGIFMIGKKRWKPASYFYGNNNYFPPHNSSMDYK